MQRDDRCLFCNITCGNDDTEMSHVDDNVEMADTDFYYDWEMLTCYKDKHNYKRTDNV